MFEEFSLIKSIVCAAEVSLMMLGGWMTKGGRKSNSVNLIELCGFLWRPMNG